MQENTSVVYCEKRRYRMRIRKATCADLPAMMELFRRAREFMAQTGNPHQWGDRAWPPRSLLEADISEGHSYVAEWDGVVVATFYYRYGRDIEPTYARIEQGEWQDDSPYGVIHRIASDRSRHGIGTYCIQWAYRQCRHLRIDTHRDNAVMRHLLEKLGFRQCGIIYVGEDSMPRIAYEKSQRIEGSQENGAGEII